jgi:cytochrome b involved in lipid metabolism
MENQFTSEEVSLHNTENDIWIIIKQNVYDITDFINKHPGGKVILLSFGGQDVTDYFEELHKNEILNEIADQYKIGVIIS